MRPDLPTYLLAILVFLLGWNTHGQAIDIQMHDTYFVIALDLVYRPLSLLLLLLGLIYSLMIYFKRKPSKLFSWIFILSTVTFLAGILMALPPELSPPSKPYYSWTAVDETFAFKGGGFMVTFLIGLLCYIVSLVCSQPNGIKSSQEEIR